MNGAGTGIAPMRALVQEREHQYQTSLKTKPTTTRGENVLYFGCKRAAEDYIYRDELEQALKDGALSQLHLAFSRDQKEKVVNVQLPLLCKMCCCRLPLFMSKYLLFSNCRWLLVGLFDFICSTCCFFVRKI